MKCKGEKNGQNGQLIGLNVEKCSQGEFPALPPVLISFTSTFIEIISLYLNVSESLYMPQHMGLPSIELYFVSE